jgi:hypothetical protein
MHKPIVLGAAVLAAAGLAAAPSAGAGSDGDGGNEVIKRGGCTAASTWKLKAKHDDGRIETEFEVDQNRVGKRWRVVLRQDGRVVFRGIRTTRAPSGSFEVRRFLRHTAGSDRIVGRARALATGEICRGVVTI